MMRYTSVALTRDGMRMFASGNLIIYLTRTPRSQGVVDGEEIVAGWKRILDFE
jgi:hypothetical protein